MHLTLCNATNWQYTVGIFFCMEWHSVATWSDSLPSSSSIFTLYNSDRRITKAATHHHTAASNFPLCSICVLLHILIVFLFFFCNYPRKSSILQSPLHCWHQDWSCAGTIQWSCQLRICGASVYQTGHSNVIVLLLISASRPPTPLSIPVTTSLWYSVKAVVHSVVWDLQFFGNFVCFWSFWVWNQTDICWCSRYLTKECQFYCLLNQNNSFKKQVYFQVTPAF